MSDDLVKRAREALDGVTPGPWAYRPQKYDDWGYVRMANPEDDGWFTFICQAKSPMLSDDGLNDCRKRGIDPWASDARFIAAARELVPAMAERIEELEAKLAKAVGAIELLHDNVVHAWPTVANLGPVAKARATLAELTGGKDDHTD